MIRAYHEEVIKPNNSPIMNMVIDQLVERLGYETSFIGESGTTRGKGPARSVRGLRSAEKNWCVSDWSRIDCSM
jgi:hypothetical protein